MGQRFLSDIHATAGLKDSSGDLGSSGQVLSSTGSNTNWVNPTVGTTVIYKDAFTATNGQTAFTLANTVDSEDKTQVYIDGAYQSKGGYTVSGTTLTFDTGLATSSAVEVITFSTATANNAATAVKLDTFTGDGSDLTFVLNEAVVDEKVTQVYINGVYQNKSTYSIAADLVTLTFGSGNAPPNSSTIEVISFKTITSTDGTFTATTFLGDLNGTINTATTATTQSAGNNSTKISTTAYTDAKVADAINNGTTAIAPSQNAVFDALALKANIAGPTFTGTPAAPTASAGTNTTQLATTAFVTTGIANIVDSSPGALNTLNELAAALGDDANFSATVTNSIGTKAPLASPTFTGNATFSGTLDVGTFTINGSGIIADAAMTLQVSGGSANALTLAASTGLATFNSSIILNNNEGIFWEATSGTNEGIVSNGSDLLFYTQGANRLTITSGGDVQINNLIKFVDPTAGSAGAPQFTTLLSYQYSTVNALSTIKGGNEASGTNGTYLKFYVNSSAAVNTPLNLLTLQSSFSNGTNANFNCDVSLADTKYIQLNNTSTDWQLRADNAGKFIIQTSGGSEFFKIRNNGEVAFGNGTAFNQFFNVRSSSTSQSLINIGTSDNSETLNVGVLGSAGYVMMENAAALNIGTGGVTRSPQSHLIGGVLLLLVGQLHLLH